MKRIAIVIVAALISTSAAANCHTIFVGGTVVTCCTYGNVTTCM